jgi:hypothetical protein
MDGSGLVLTRLSEVDFQIRQASLHGTSICNNRVLDRSVNSDKLYRINMLQKY